MQDAADVELLEDMRDKLEQMAKNAELLPEEDRKQCDETMTALNGTINELKEKIELMKKQNSDYSQMIAEKSSENARLRNKLKAFEQDEREELDFENEITVNDNFDVRERNADNKWKKDFPQKVSMVVPWLREKYEDTVYIHDDAEKAFDKIAKSDLNIKRFCEAFAFLDAYARFRGGKLSPEFYEAIEMRTSFRAIPTGFEGSQIDAPAYFVDLDYGNVNKRSVICELHLKYSANSNETFRIYFTYIEEIGKVVVGSMPDHLSVGVNDNRNRRKKV